MKRLFYLPHFILCLFILTACFNPPENPDKKFFSEYGQILELGIHTPLLSENIEVALKNELNECIKNKVDCESIKKQLGSIIKNVEEYHKVIIPELTLPKARCPCPPAQGCVWHPKPLERLIVENDIYIINELNIRSQNGKSIVAKMQKKVDSPSGKYSVYIFDKLSAPIPNTVILHHDLDLISTGENIKTDLEINVIQ